MDGRTSRSIKETMTKHFTHIKDALVKGFGSEGPTAAQILESGKVYVAGVLRKLRDETRIRMASWHLVYAIVDEERLYYYEDETSEQPLGLISLRGCNQVRRIEKFSGSFNSAFAICRPAKQGRSREYTFATLSSAELAGWMTKIKDAMTLVNKEKVETAVLQAVASKPKDTIPRRRQPTPPHSDTENEIKGIEEPLYQDLDSSESAEEPAESDEDCDTDGSTQSDYLPPAVAFGPNTKGTGTMPKVSEIKHDNSVGHHNSRIPGGISVFPPPLKPHVPPKPPSSKGSTLPPPATQKTKDISIGGSGGATKTFSRPKNPSKTSPPADTTAAPRIYWSGEAEEAMSALKECSDRGTYLIRHSNSDEPSVTLVVYIDDSRLRKVKLFKSSGTADESTTWYVRQMNSGEGFSSLEDLVKHYSTMPLNLNSTTVRLTKPLQHHMMSSSLPPH